MSIDPQLKIKLFWPLKASWEWTGVNSTWLADVTFISAISNINFTRTLDVHHVISQLTEFSTYWSEIWSEICCVSGLCGSSACCLFFPLLYLIHLVCVWWTTSRSGAPNRSPWWWSPSSTIWSPWWYSRGRRSQVTLCYTHTHTHTMTCRFHNLHHMRGTSISSPYHHGNTSYCITVNSSNLFNRRTSSLCRHTTTRVRACFLTGRRSSGRPDPPLWPLITWQRRPIRMAHVVSLSCDNVNWTNTQWIWDTIYIIHQSVVVLTAAESVQNTSESRLHRPVSTRRKHQSLSTVNIHSFDLNFGFKMSSALMASLLLDSDF